MWQSINILKQKRDILWTKINKWLKAINKLKLWRLSKQSKLWQSYKQRNWLWQSIWTKLSLWQSESVSWIPVYQSTCISVYKYTSHTKKRQYTSLSVYQSICIPVTQKSSIPVHLYTSHENTCIPVAAVTMLPPLDVSAPSSRCLWVVAPSSRCHLHVDHICPNRPGVKLGPQGPLPYRPGENTRPPGPSSRFLGNW